MSLTASIVEPGAPELVHDADCPPASPDLAATAGGLLERLRQAPEKFDFFAIMRQLEAAFAHRPGFGRSVRPSEDPLRLGQEPAVSHAPASLAGTKLALKVVQTGFWCISLAYSDRTGRCRCI